MKSISTVGIVLTVFFLSLSVAHAGTDAPYPIYGYVNNSDGTPADGALVTICMAGDSVNNTTAVVGVSYGVSGWWKADLYNIPPVGILTIGSGDTITVEVSDDDSNTGVATIVVDTSIMGAHRVADVTISPSQDTTPPTVTGSTPTGTDVPVSAAITVTFDEAMNQASAEGAFFIDPSVTGTTSWAGNTITFTPDTDFAYSTTYNMTIGTIAEDLAGNPLADDFTWGFTTKSAPASPSPSITDWSNDKTNDNSSVITVNESELIRFNATADQTIDKWDWYKDGVNQSCNFDNYTASWSVNGTYSVSVNATNANGTSNTIPWTITVNDITPPAQVSGLTNDTPTTATVNLSWNASTESDLVGYRVYRDGSLLNSTANTYYNVTGLAAGTTYEFNVSAYDDNDLEGGNASVSVTTPVPPIAPTITDRSNDKTNDNSSAITVNEYESIRFNATADQTIGTWNWCKDGVDQSCNFDNYTASWGVNGTYSVSVNATNVNGSDTVSWTITVNDITPPAQVSGLTNDTPTTATVNLSWNASTESDLVGYRVYRDGSLLNSTANTYYNVTGLAAGTTYEFDVSAYDDNDLEGGNASVTVTTAAHPAPSITSSTPPSSPVDDIGGAIQTFSIEIDQTVDVIWYINGSEVQTNSSVTTASYTNTSAEVGCWNVSAIVSNANGDAMQEWIWNVTPGDVSRIGVASPDPLPTNIGMNGTFNANCYNANDYLIDATVAWDSSNLYVGTINETGYFEALHAGPTNITAESDGVTSDAVTITVDGPVNNSTTTADIEFTVTSGDATATGNFSVGGWVNATAIGDPEENANCIIGSDVIQIKGAVINVSDSILEEMEAGNTLTLTICYNATDTTLEGIDTGTIAIWKFNEISGEWEKLSGTTSGNCVSVTLNHLCIFALAGKSSPPPGGNNGHRGGGGGSGSGTYPPGGGKYASALTPAVTPAPTDATPEPTVAETDEPTVTQTEAPPTETETKETKAETTEMETKGTPGFGAVLTVFAIAGLLVATYLVMRRRE